MKRKNIVSFFTGLLVTGIVYFIFFTFLEFSFFSFAQQTLQEWENMYFIEFICTGIILFLSILFINRQIAQNRRFLLAGISIPFFCLIVLFVSYGKTYLSGVVFKTPFNSEIWKQVNPKSFEMARTLVKNDSLRKLNSKQVIELLGNPVNSSDSEYLEYYIEDGWTVRIDFKNQVVSEITMISAGLDL